MRGWAAVGRRRGGACCRSASRIGDWRGTENRGLRIGCLSIVCNYLTVGGQGCVAHIWGSKVLAGVKRSKANRGFGGGERGLCVSHDCGRGGQSDTLWRFRRCDGDHGTHTCGMSSRVRFTAVASFDQDKTLTTMPFSSRFPSLPLQSCPTSFVGGSGFGRCNIALVCSGVDSAAGLARAKRVPRTGDDSPGAGAGGPMGSKTLCV